MTGLGYELRGSYIIIIMIIISITIAIEFKVHGDSQSVSLTCIANFVCDQNSLMHGLIERPSMKACVLENLDLLRLNLEAVLIQNYEAVIRCCVDHLYHS